MRRASVLVLLAGLLAVPAAVQAAEGERLAGPSRIDTAVAIAEAAFPESAEHVYLARADVFADAVAGGSLRDGPTLLVPACGPVPPTVLDAVERLEPSEVVALGGEEAVCNDLLDEAAGGRNTARTAGPSRIATAVEISRRAFPGGADAVYLARADVLADAVASGSLQDGPVLLVPSTGEAPPDVTAEVARLGPRSVVALGTADVLADEVLDAAAAGVPTARLGGATRIETAVAISGRAWPSAGTVYLARADVFADAVAAGALTAGPVLLVPQCGELPSAVAGELDRLRPDRVVALGSEAAVCGALLDAAVAVASGAPEPPPVPPEPEDIDLARQLPLVIEPMFGECGPSPASPLLPPDASCVSVVEVDLDGDIDPDRLLLFVTAGGQRHATAVTTRAGRSEISLGSDEFGRLGPISRGQADGVPGEELFVFDGFGANTGPVLILTLDGDGLAVVEEAGTGLPATLALGGGARQGSGFSCDDTSGDGVPDLQERYWQYRDDNLTWDWFERDLHWVDKALVRGGERTGTFQRPAEEDYDVRMREYSSPLCGRTFEGSLFE